MQLYFSKGYMNCDFIQQWHHHTAVNYEWCMARVFQEEGGYDPNVSDKANCCLFHQYRPIHLHVFTNLLSSLSSIFKAS